MFFLIITTNLALYLSSLQLIGVGSGLAGGLVFTGGLVMTALSALFYQYRHEHVHHKNSSSSSSKLGIFKKIKKLDKLCDCDCDGPDCCGCD